MEPNNSSSGFSRDRSQGTDSVFGVGVHASIPGLILVGIGVLFLLGNLHIVRAIDWFEYWPVILIAVGLVQLVDSCSSLGRVWGGILLGVGGLFLADNLGYLPFSVGDLWPLILIAVGLMLLFERTWGVRTWGGRWFRDWNSWHTFGGSKAYTGDVLHEVSIFGGSRRTVAAQDFKGGRISSIFGGVVLDLTPAHIAGDSAVLDVAAVYGGVSIRIPTTWNAEVRGAGIFGGFSDRTDHPRPGPEVKRLIVRGAGIFGGVTIKN
ncbi:MAG TPA: DUF5668 domain-containing protein [Bryobacteraceae bacterium]|nr:DUF5668 domain-containing protein [Bryobacteraceae bacterium]